MFFFLLLPLILLAGVEGAAASSSSSSPDESGTAASASAGLRSLRLSSSAPHRPPPPRTHAQARDGARSKRNAHEPLVRTYRPDPSTWSRTQCGHPSGNADLVTRWAADAYPGGGSPDDENKSPPLNAYPRPQAVRCGLSSSSSDGGLGERCLGRERGLGEDGGGGAAIDVDVTRLRDEGDRTTWQNLNGLWEWEKATENGGGGSQPIDPPFGHTLNRSILVPFPVESCLSGVAPNRTADIVRSMWYRLTFDAVLRPPGGSAGTLLHFGAVDWMTYVYLNGRLLGNHTGGYDGFSFDVTSHLNFGGEGEGGKDAPNNELLVYAYDPSDSGHQPEGKQRASAIDDCHGDTYTPSSGIWQTVWLEAVPADNPYIEEVRIDQASLERVAVTVSVSSAGTKTDAAPSSTAASVSGGGDGGDGGLEVKVEVLDMLNVVADNTGVPGEEVTVTVPDAILWSPSRPFLYDLRVTLRTLTRVRSRGDDDGIPEVLDVVISYFGLRTFEATKTSAAASASGGGDILRPTLNGRPVFLAGVLDQSFWPDGLYAAPSDEALAFDVELVPQLGMNLIRLHQKVNPERWYYHADRLGVLVFQDFPQKMYGATNETVPLFVQDMTAAIRGRGNHPSIVQWDIFNEGDCWKVFTEKPYDVPGMVDLVRSLDPTPRLVDTDSGGGANDLHVGDVNDVHTYPYPGDPMPSVTQYAMVGEYGGLGLFVDGKQWKPGGCFAYRKCDSSTEYALLYAGMASLMEGRKDNVGAVVYTQTTDLECECDGLVNYDRTAKFGEEEVELIRRANERLTRGSVWTDGDAVESLVASA